jgi:hypothetical protein
MATRIDDAIVLSLATQQTFRRFPHFCSAWATATRGREKDQPRGHPRCPDSAVEATTRRTLLYTHCLELCGCQFVSGAHLRAGSPVIIPFSSRTFLGIPASTNQQDVPDPAVAHRSFHPNCRPARSSLSLSLCARNVLPLALQDVVTGKTSGCCLMQDVVSDLVKEHSLGVIVAPLFSSWRHRCSQVN